MHVRRTLAVAGAAVAAAPLLAVLGPAAPAAAHGTLSDPPSRIYTCWSEGAERPTSNGCKAAVAAGGSGPMYDWNEVSLLDAGGQHQAKIPDGKLCGAGRDKFRGLDLPGTGWKATKVSPGPRVVTYRATAPHASSDFDFFITRAGFNPNAALRWSDLEPIASFKPPVTTAPTTTPPAAGGTWAPNTAYRTGERVTYHGVAYTVRQAHTSLPGWEPPNVPALWSVA